MWEPMNTRPSAIGARSTTKSPGRIDDQVAGLRDGADQATESAETA
jgi:hypothetical protein